MKKNAEKIMIAAQPPLDCFDLSYIAPVLTAGALVDKVTTPFDIGAEVRLGFAAAARSGHVIRRLAFERLFLKASTSIEKALEFRSGLVAHWFTSIYTPRPYQYILIAPPMGSMAYLSSVLDAPLLPLNYRYAISFDKPSKMDSTAEYLKASKAFAERFIEKDPDVEVIAEFDPAHERFRISRSALLRFKFKSLPRPYVQFIRSNLAPGGAIILVEPRTGWSQYKVADNISLQVGLSGGITDEEFLRGSKRMTEFREKHLNYDKISYRVNLPEEVKPESRYGVAPSVRTSILNEAAELRRPICQIFSSDVNQINNLVSSLFARCARREGKRPSRVFIHSGIFIAPKECIDAVMLPIWVPDTGFQSLAFVQQLIDSYPFKTETAVLSLEPSLAGPPDVLPFERWRKAAETRGNVICAGNTDRLFPFDASAYFRFWRSIRSYARRMKDPLDVRVNLDLLIEEARNCNIYFTMYQ